MRGIVCANKKFKAVFAGVPGSRRDASRAGDLTLGNRKAGNLVDWKRGERLQDRDRFGTLNRDQRCLFAEIARNRRGDG